MITIENKQVDENRIKNNQVAVELKTPTENQLRYITRLANMAGVRIDAGKIDSQKAASLIIVKLQSMTGQITAGDLRDKRIAFAMTTKLMFMKYLHIGINSTISDRFWRDVEEFFRQYQEHQAVIVK